MQAIEHDGIKRAMELFDQEKLQEHLNDPDVAEVRVFRLQKGMRINVNGAEYKVITVRPNGKATIKPTGNEYGEDKCVG